MQLTQRADEPPLYLRGQRGIRDPYAGSHEDELTFWSSYFGALLFAHLEVRKGVTGLDVACGGGFPLLELAMRHGPSSHFAGIDHSQAAIARAEGKRYAYGITNVELFHGDAVAMPFDDRAFTLITCNLGLNNFESPAKVFAECHRVMQPGGRIALTTNIMGHMDLAYDVLREVAWNRSMGEVIEKLDEHERHRGTPSTIAESLSAAGFRVKRTYEDSFLMSYADGTSMLRHRFLAHFVLAWRELMPESEEREFFAEAESRFNAIARRFGSLHQRIPMLYVEAVRL